MRMPFRQRRLLRRTDRALRRSDPELAALLSAFSRRHAGARMPAWEQLRPGEAPTWYMMPWPMASGFLAVWAAAGGLMYGAPRIGGRGPATDRDALTQAQFGMGRWPD
jgi:hypothetical protein